MNYRSQVHLDYHEITNIARPYQRIGNFLDLLSSFREPSQQTIHCAEYQRAAHLYTPPQDTIPPHTIRPEAEHGASPSPCAAGEGRGGGTSSLHDSVVHQVLHRPKHPPIPTFSRSRGKELPLISRYPFPVCRADSRCLRLHLHILNNAFLIKPYQTKQRLGHSLPRQTEGALTKLLITATLSSFP